MLVEMKSTGVLKIEAENELEAYALRKWAEEYLDQAGSDDDVDLMREPKYPGIIVNWGL